MNVKNFSAYRAVHIVNGIRLVNAFVFTEPPFIVNWTAQTLQAFDGATHTCVCVCVSVSLSVSVSVSVCVSVSVSVSVSVCVRVRV